MSLIRSHGNKATELRLIQVFRKHRITGWRRKQKILGSPDFILRAERLCVFVDGCFWHGCPKPIRKGQALRFAVNRRQEVLQAGGTMARKLRLEFEGAVCAEILIWEAH